MSKLTDVFCTYTGGGIYIITAKFGDVYLCTDLGEYGSYDIPFNEIEEHDHEYDDHWKDPAEPLPTWAELFDAVKESYEAGVSLNVDIDEVERILKYYHPDTSIRLNEQDPIVEEDEPDPEKKFPISSDKRLDTIAPIIEIFEDFLDDKGIVIENDEKEESESPSNIYGTDWGNLCDRIEAYLVELGVLEEEK